MFGPLQLLIWVSSIALELYIVGRAVYRRELLRYFPLCFYLLLLAVFGITRMWVLQAYGLGSQAYLYTYYYSDVLLTIFLYFAILSLYMLVFEEMKVSRYIRAGGSALLVLTALVSYSMIHQNAANLTGRFVVELSQNLYFVGVVLTYVLWGAVMQLRETRTRIVQLVLSLGVFFSAHAVVYAARHLFPDYAPWFSWAPALLGLILPMTWAYTFTMVSEEARLDPARVGSRRGRVRSVATAHR